MGNIYPTLYQHDMWAYNTYVFCRDNDYEDGGDDDESPTSPPSSAVSSQSIESLDM